MEIIRAYAKNDIRIIMAWTTGHCVLLRYLVMKIKEHNRCRICSGVSCPSPHILHMLCSLIFMTRWCRRTQCPVAHAMMIWTSFFAYARMISIGLVWLISGSSSLDWRQVVSLLHHFTHFFLMPSHILHFNMLVGIGSNGSGP